MYCTPIVGMVAATTTIRRKSSDRLSRVKIVCGVEYHTSYYLLLLPRAVSCSRIWALFHVRSFVCVEHESRRGNLPSEQEEVN